MKTQDLKNKSKQGSVLVITMSVVAVAVLVLASYLIVVQSQVSSVSRSQTWNSAISLAEAGMEEGMATINYGQPSISPNSFAFTNILSSTGWTLSNGTNASKTNFVYGSNYYIANISWSGTNAPTVSAVGIVSYSTVPWVFSAMKQHAFLAQAGSGTGSGSTGTTSVSMGRKIQASTVLSPVFSAAIVCRSNFDMAGNNCTIDSFDSSSIVGGQWAVAYRQANGNVATDSALVNSANIANGNVYGSVYTGPGTVQSSVQIGPNGSVGGTNWVPTKGIQSGHWAGIYNMNIPDVPAPDTNGWNTSLPAAINGSILLTGGNYVVSSLSSPLIVSNATTTLWVNSPGAVSLGVTITNGGQLILYVGQTTGSGTSLGWSGNGTCNAGGYAANLQIYGLPSLTSVDFHGNASWTGTLYAPEAAFVGGGSGNNSIDTSGAVVCNSVKLGGKWNFHYDQSLMVSGPSRGFIATGWKEVSYTP